MKKFIFTSIFIASLISFIFTVHAENDDRKASGYYTTDMWLLAITPFKPISLDHVVLGQMPRDVIRGLNGTNNIIFIHYGMEFDVAILENLIIAIYYIDDMTSNVICLGDLVDQ